MPAAVVLERRSVPHPEVVPALVGGDAERLAAGQLLGEGGRLLGFGDEAGEQLAADLGPGEARGEPHLVALLLLRIGGAR